jgi:hypothetical protein
MRVLAAALATVICLLAGNAPNAPRGADRFAGCFRVAPVLPTTVGVVAATGGAVQARATGRAGG